MIDTRKAIPANTAIKMVMPVITMAPNQLINRSLKIPINARKRPTQKHEASIKTDIVLDTKAQSAKGLKKMMTIKTTPIAHTSFGNSGDSRFLFFIEGGNGTSVSLAAA
jgi:hypothetical protein